MLVLSSVLVGRILVLAMSLVLLGACMFVENAMGAPLVVAAGYGLMRASGVSVRKVKTV